MLKKHKWFQIIILSSLTVLMAGCPKVSDDDATVGGKDSNDNLNAPSGEPSGDYISTEVTVNGAPHALVDGTDIHIGFDAGELSARAGCNSMFGPYQVVDGILNVSQMSMTEMGCDEPRHAQDNWVVDILGASPAISLGGDILTVTAILDDGTEVVLTLLDEAVAIPDLPLVGTVWTVDTIFDGAAASSSNWPQAATMEFNADGTLDLFAGCNSGSGSYTLTDTSIVVTGLGVTEIACEDQQAMALEQTVLDFLYSDGAIQMEIDQHRLDLMRGQTGLGLKGTAQ